MKKFLLWTVLSFALVACDRPQAEMFIMPCCDLEYLGLIKIDIYDDTRVVATVQGKKVELKFSDDDKSQCYMDGLCFLELNGKIPDTEDEISFSVQYDYNQHLLNFAAVGLSGVRGSMGTQAMVPMRLKKFDKTLTESEQIRCKKEIQENVFVRNGVLWVSQGKNVALYAGGRTKSDGWFYNQITADDALQINEKWNYDANDWWKKDEDDMFRFTEFGDDACVTAERLKNYIAAHGWNQERQIVIDEITCAHPQRVHLMCNNFESVVPTYLTLNICDNGQHLLNIASDHVLDDVDYLPMTETSDGGAVLYSAAPEWWRPVALRYDTASGVYVVRHEEASGAFGTCEVGNFAQHQICARYISSVTKVNPDGTIALNLNWGQYVTEDGFDVKEEFITLTAEQALSVSKNWKYGNLHLYSTGDMPHELDACTAWKNLRYLWANLR